MARGGGDARRERVVRNELLRFVGGVLDAVVSTDRGQTGRSVFGGTCSWICNALSILFKLGKRIERARIRFTASAPFEERAYIHHWHRMDLSRVIRPEYGMPVTVLHNHRRACCLF